MSCRYGQLAGQQKVEPVLYCEALHIDHLYLQPTISEALHIDLVGNHNSPKFRNYMLYI